MSTSWSVLGKGGAAVARVELRRGQSVKAEPDALITMSQHVELGANMDAGVMRGVSVKSRFSPAPLGLFEP